MAPEREFYAREGNLTPSLIGLMGLTRDEFNRRFKDSPVKRAKHAGFLRNVAVALGNSGDPAAIPALEAALDHEEPLVRAHAAWALGRLGGRAALAGRHRLARLCGGIFLRRRGQSDLALAFQRGRPVDAKVADGREQPPRILPARRRLDGH